MFIMPAGMPLVERNAGEFHGIGSVPHAPVKIAVDDVMLIGPVAAEQITRIKVNYVVREDERDVRFRSSAHQLIFFTESKDVIAQNIFASVMLMKPGAFAAIDDVAVKAESGTPSIGVKAHPALRA